MTRSSTVRFVSIASATQIIGPSLERVTLVFSPPASGSYTVSNASPAIGEGMTLTAGGPPLELTIEKNGDCVQKAWFAVPDSGTVKVGYIETIG